MQPMPVAVIGAGSWGTSQAGVFDDHPGVELVAVCYLDASRAEALARAHGARPHTDAQRMFAAEALEAVGIATPDHAHRDVVIAAAEAGVAILVEKPLATNVEDVEAIAAVECEWGVRVMVDFHSRYSPPFNVAKDAIERGELGTLVSAYYRVNDTIEVPLRMLAWAAESSIVWFLGSHTVDTLRRFTAERMDYPDVFVLPKVHGRSVGFAHASIWDVCDRVISGAPFVVGLDDGVAVTKTVCAMLESSRVGQPVDVAL